MWWYYQTTHNKSEDWSATDAKGLDQVRSGKALHMSMLGVSVPDSEFTDYSKARYHGDLIVDIDHPVEEMELAIKSANKVVDFFDGRCDLQFLQIFASGVKGFHIVIPWELFYSNKTGVQSLHLKYKSIAKRILIETGATGIDMSLYAGKRGHLVRLPNKRRKEGTYKVPVTLEELRALTPEKYKDLVKEPRHLEHARPQTISLPCATLLAEAEVFEKEATFEAVPSELLAQFGVDNHPECIKHLVNFDAKRNGVNYNQTAMQLVIYLRSVQMPPAEQDLLVDTLVARAKSTTYNTPEKRRRHILHEIGTAAKDYSFSCAAMRRAVDAPTMCSQCPVEQAAARAKVSETGIEEPEGGGYVYVNSEGVRRILTDFTIRVAESYVPSDSKGRSKEYWHSAKFEVTRNGVTVHEFYAGKEVLETLKDFRTAFLAVRGAFIDISDRDLDRLRIYILQQSKDLKSMKATHQVGIRKIWHTPEDEQEIGAYGSDPIELMAWVEEDWAFALGIEINIKLSKAVSNTVQYKTRQSPLGFDEGIQATLLRLLNSSRPDVVGRLLGWVVACHLKPHIQDQTQSFPLLHLYGVSQSGKTSLAKVFSALGAADYRTSPPVLPSMSPWPLKDLVTCSVSIPRILDEVNKTKMHPSKWTAARDALRAVYQGGVISTGGLKTNKLTFDGPGVTSYDRIASSPMIILGTCALDEAELWNRSVEIGIAKSIHSEQGGLYRDSFRAIQNSPYDEWERLFDAARILVKEAVMLPPAVVWAMYQEEQRKLSQFSENVALCFTWVYVGLRFFKQVMEQVGYGATLLDEIDRITEATEEWVKTETPKIQLRKERTEVDAYFEMLSALCDMREQGRPKFQSGVDYYKFEHVLYLSLQSSHFLYIEGCRALGTMVEFQRVQQLLEALEGMDFYLGTDVLPGVVGRWHMFDLNILEKRGNDVSRFVESGQ